jgi:hypothetical protein
LSGSSRYGAGAVFPGVIAVALIAFLFASCSDDESQVTAPPELTGIVTSVNVRPEQITGYGAVEIRVGLINHDSEPREIKFDTLDYLGLEVQTPDTLLTFPCVPDSGSSSITLQPGGGRIVIMLFSGYRASDFCPSPQDTLRVGDYTVRAGLLGYSREYPWGEDGFEVIE